jgi:hypothetical protein
MPELKSFEVQAQHVRKSDLFSQDGHAIESVDVKTKWTTITQVTGAKVRLENETLVTVLRSVDTVNDKLHHAEVDIMKTVKSTQMAVADAAGVFAGDAVKNRVDCMWSCATALYEAMATRDIYATIAHIAERSTNDGLAFPFVHATIVYGEELAEALLDNRFRQSSTNSLSNVAEEFQQKAASNFLRSYQVYAIRAALRSEDA